MFIFILAILIISELNWAETIGEAGSEIANDIIQTDDC